MDETVKGVVTVVKADGPGWLIIAETLDNNRYRVVRELFGDEPATAEVMEFLDRLPRRWSKIEGAEVELARPDKVVSPKRAARQAARVVAEARDPGRSQPTKAMRFKSAEIELAKATGQTTREETVDVLVRFNKKRVTVLPKPEGGRLVVEINGTAADPDSNRRVAAALAHYFGTTTARVELLHGYASPRKSFQLTLFNN